MRHTQISRKSVLCIENSLGADPKAGREPGMAKEEQNARVEGPERRKDCLTMKSGQ